MVDFVPVDHDPFAAEQFVPPFLADWAKQAAGKDVNALRNAGQSAADLANLPERALGAAANLQTTGDYNPAPVMDAAMLPMGTGAIAGVPIKAGETVLGAGLIPGNGPEARAAWSELRQEVAKRKADAKAMYDALARPIEDTGPSGMEGMSDDQLADHMEKLLREANAIRGGQ